MNARSEADVRSLAILFDVGTSCGLSDVELLERFLDSSEEAAEFAFEGLVVRHGPMVLDVCRKILADAHDAQDAFQATFLILATRAKSIRKQRSVGSWLHGVALRVARRARSDAMRRRAQERRIAEMTTRDIEAGPPSEPDDFRVLHEEVQRLPRKYREPIVLCYLEGMPLEAVAGRLGCPIGTVGVRLMRARERLKDRLGRRGVSAADGLVISSRDGSAILPAALIRSTAGAAVRFTSGGTVSLAAARLASEVLRSMVMIQLAKMSAAVLAGVIAATSYGGLVVHSEMLARRRPAGERVPDGAPFRIGQKVVTKYQAALRDGDQVVEDGSMFRVYAVDQVDGERVRLISEDVSGWVQASEIVPLDEAIDFYTKEIERNPNGGAAYHCRGLIWKLDSQYEKAIADFTEAIRLGPQAYTTLVVRGNTFSERDKYDKALADFTEAIRLDPEYVLAHRGRARLHYAKKEYDKAIIDLNEAIRLDPNYADGYSMRGATWLAKGEWDKVLPDLDEAIRLDSEARCRVHQPSLRLDE